VYAKEQIRDENIEFLCADINDLESISLPRFDLLISIGTLQSSNINFNERFMYIFQNHLEKNGSIVLGFPNCRWIDGEMIYGAKAPNYSFNEMSLVLKDIHFCKKYLQQKKYRVVITGKDYLFLSARKIESSNTNI
jgi:cyclopropane fatty-acyl-phospholipid synthase-like methyltransferase